ncbi:ABC transporter ATP-binding protein [Alteromonas sediminis]|uniref:ABC transporter ATP-binding protein n=1 Tax=Alteromonas sediminis TaxID=2259342 RepID=A0A3N5XZ63_9ALTE|nr:ABC transporter ATP-binding protein [Alteromonas sediminis]RPJ66567.1 ABC transporter ATP-binding protein [Alteromonas sediminis]
MLSVKHVNKTYSDGTHALRDINLELPNGMVGLLGPNGAGKSTLMRTLACIQSPDSGEMTFAGINVLDNPMAIRKQLGYLPQDFGVYPYMSCRSLLKHMAVLKGVNDKSVQRQHIDSLLELTNLSHVADKHVSTFSGGMRQRFGIAQALLGDPKLVIMDEPTAGLDPAERDRLHNLLVSISQDKLILLSTHIVEDVENLCQHVTLINSGQVVESNPIDKLIAPLCKNLWQSDKPPGDHGLLLNKSYHHGKPSFRFFSEQSPHFDAQPAEATLQDRYFFELAKQGTSA